MPKNANWKDLVGQCVQVQKDGKLIRTGYVDVVVDSADILWLQADGVKQRALFEKAMGYTVQPHSIPVMQHM